MLVQYIVVNRQTFISNTNKIDNVNLWPFPKIKPLQMKPLILGDEEEPEDGGQKNKLKRECVTNM